MCSGHERLGTIQPTLEIPLGWNRAVGLCVFPPAPVPVSRTLSLSPSGPFGKVHGSRYYMGSILRLPFSAGEGNLYENGDHFGVGRCLSPSGHLAFRHALGRNASLAQLNSVKTA